MIAASFDGSEQTGIDQEIRNAQQLIIVRKLIALAGKGGSPAVRGIALLKLEKLRSRGPKAAAGASGQALLIADLIRRFQSAADPAAGTLPEPKLPAGPPLGD